MDLTALQHIYQQGGPFATVYLEGRPPGEDARQELRLRWKALRERLESEDAPQEPLNAIDSALQSALSGEEQADGRVLVANSEGVLLHAPWDAALGTGDNAVWQELPQLGPYLREQSRAVRMLLVVADQVSARVRQEVIAPQHEPREIGEQDISTSDIEHPSGQGGDQRHMVHKPRGQAEAQGRIQRRADEATKAYGKETNDELRKIAGTFQPHVVVLAGETKAREAIRAELADELDRLVVETDRGGEAAGESEAALTDELLRIARDVRGRREEQRRQHWSAAMAHELAAQGAADVAHAAEQGAVETLLFAPDTTAIRESFLIKACAQTAAAVDLVTTDTELPEGIGAVLRYRMTS